MALFKIFENFTSGNTSLPTTAVQGYCYFDKNTGKFYIDTTNTTAGRMALNANKADRLSNTSKIGDTDKPVYFTADGTPTAISYTIAKNVPSDAVFTDTWNAMTGATSSANGTVGYINTTPPKDGYNTKFWRADGTWAEPAGTYTYTLPTASSSTKGGIKVNGNGLKVESDTLKHSNAVTAKTAYGSTATAVSTNGGTLTVTDIKYDANGHITASTDRTITFSQDGGEDTKVYQGVSSSTAWRKVLLSYSQYENEFDTVTTATNQVYQSANIEAQPSNGFLKARGFYLAGEGTTPAFRIYNGDTQVGMFKSTATGTSTTQGQCQINIGNEVAEGTAGNAKGFIALYGADAARHLISSNLTGSTNRNVFLQNYAGLQYLVHASTTAAIGGIDQAVYVAANGHIDAIETDNLKAGKDGSGNTITSTYVKKSGDTMTGTLTLSSGNVRVETGNMALRLVGYTRGTTASAAVDRSFSFYDDGYNRLVGRMQCTADTSGVNKVYMMVYRNNATAASAAFYIQYDSTTSSAGCNAAEFRGNKVYGAVYNDYAEFRETEEIIEAGRCVYEQGNGKLALSDKRLMRGCELVSDTYGFAIGQSEKAQTPIAVTGRVLAYCLEGQEAAKKFIGYPVCSGPNGTVSIMTEEEEAKYPSRIIGTISEVPNYDQWQCGDKDNSSAVNVNGRIWIRVR